MHRDARSIGILAGGGVLPREIADAAVAHGHTVHVVAIDGEADLDQFGDHKVTLVNWGQIGRMLSTLKAAKVDDLIIVGRVTRPDFRRLRTDFGFFRSVPEIIRIVAAGGDDGVLRRVVRFFENHGLHVVGASDIAPDLVIGRGPLGAEPVPTGLGPDIALGFEVIQTLGRFDIGQAVVVRDGQVVAIEAAEGTDAMLMRLAEDAGTVRRGVLIKRPKPGQERRIDFPAIGPDTIHNAVRAGLAGLVVEAGGAMAAERGRLIREADRAQLFVAGVEDTWLPPDRTQTKPARRKLRRFAGADAYNDRDGKIALSVIEALAPRHHSAAVVVVRGYVIAVDAGEGARAVVARAAKLKQWGGKGRRGAIGLASAKDIDRDLLVQAGEAGLACMAYFDDQGGIEDRDGSIAKACQAGGVRLMPVARDTIA